MSDTPMHNTWDIQAWLQRKEEKALERVLQMVGTLQRLGPEQCEELKAIVADVERWRLEVDLVVKLNTAIDDMNALTDEDRKARFDSLDAGTAERLGDLVDRLGECGRRLTKLTREERHDMEGILSRLLGQSGEALSRAALCCDHMCVRLPLPPPHSPIPYASPSPPSPPRASSAR